jgi:hypothetical protein
MIALPKTAAIVMIIQHRLCKNKMLPIINDTMVITMHSIRTLTTTPKNVDKIRPPFVMCVFCWSGIDV